MVSKVCSPSCSLRKVATKPIVLWKQSHVSKGKNLGAITDRLRCLPEMSYKLSKCLVSLAVDPEAPQPDTQPEGNTQSCS